MASQKSARRSRKRHSSAKTPRAVPSRRREQAAVRTAAARPPRQVSAMSAYGERPPSPFGGLPVSEIAIFAGAIAVLVGLVQGGGAALIVGVVVCVLAVLEVTLREHLSGYRSHAVLLAAMAAVAVETVLAIWIVPGARLALLVVMVPVFGIVFTGLRRRFTEARQERVRAMPPA